MHLVPLLEQLLRHVGTVLASDTSNEGALRLSQDSSGSKILRTTDYVGDSLLPAYTAIVSDVVAVIPTFRPDKLALTALLSTLRDQQAPVLIADDASGQVADELLMDIERTGVVVVRHEDNAGIARSLNDGLRWAAESSATWLLTVDQDSTIASDYVARLLASAEAAVDILGCHSVGAIGPAGIDDASGALAYPTRHVLGLPCTDELIQSGTLWSVSGLLAIGGFDESFGIDAVDAAACVRLRASGRRILLAPELSIGHRVGQGRQVRVLGRSVLASGHSPNRRTTIVRNRLRLAPEEFAQSPQHAFRTLRRVAMSTALAVTIEDQRWAKAKASARGLLPKRNG